jgi:hypothetical protein
VEEARASTANFVTSVFTMDAKEWGERGRDVLRFDVILLFFLLLGYFAPEFIVPVSTACLLFDVVLYVYCRYRAGIKAVN